MSALSEILKSIVLLGAIAIGAGILNRLLTPQPTPTDIGAAIAQVMPVMVQMMLIMMPMMLMMRMMMAPMTMLTRWY